MLYPYQVNPTHFPFPVKISRALTGHIYIRPVNNLSPFSAQEENEIVKILAAFGIGTIKNTVKSNFTTTEIKAGFGFRIFQR